MCDLWQRHAYNSLDTLCMPSGRNNRSRRPLQSSFGVGLSSLIITPIWPLWQVSFSMIGGERRSQIDRKIDVSLKITFITFGVYDLINDDPS